MQPKQETDTSAPTKDVLLLRREAAAILKISPATMANWTSSGRGPGHYKFGDGLVRYSEREVLAWVKGTYRKGE